MVEVMNCPDFLSEFLKTLKTELLKVGIEADTDVEPVPSTKLNRVFVLSANFAQMRHTERQDLVWRIADRKLNPEEQMQISMILTVTPEEIGHTDDASK